MIHHLYFASYEPNGGIYHYTMKDGVIRFEEKTDCDRPMYLDVQKGSMQVILRAPFDSEDSTRSSHSALVEYPVDAEGRLGMHGEFIETQGVVACHLCRYEGKIFAANYLSGSVFASDGLVKGHTGNGPHLTRQEASHLHYVQSSPDGKCLFAVDLGTDSIYSYDKNLNLVSTAHVPAGSGARHLAYSEDGKYVFCVNELESSVSVFAYEATKLTLLQTVSVLEKENKASTAAAIRVKGRYVYVSNRGEDSISCLEWNGSYLQLRSVTPCGGNSPRDFLQVENLMFITNEKSNNVTVFRVNGPVLTKVEEEFSIPGPLCVVELVL